MAKRRIIHCDTCNKDYDYSNNDWSNHQKWHTREVLKQELEKQQN